MPRHHAALLVVLGLLTGCVHGRPDPRAARDSSIPPVAMRPIPSLRETINGDLHMADAAVPPTGVEAAPAGPSPGRPPAPRPVSIATLPSIRDTINQGPKPVPETTPTTPASAEPVAVQPPAALPPLPTEVAASASSPEPVVVQPPAELPPLPSEAAALAPTAPPELPPLPAEAPISDVVNVQAPPTDPAVQEAVIAPAEPNIQPAPIPEPITIVDPPPVVSDPPASAPVKDVPVVEVAPPVDTAVRPVVASDPTELRSKLDTGKVISHTVVTVGSESISLSELHDAVYEFVRVNVPKGQKISKEDSNLISRNVLEGLIDQALLAQEAKHILLKSDKQRQAFDEFIEKTWKEQEIPKLLRRHDVKSERALREKLEEQGRSLDLVRDRFRRDTMAQEFMIQAMKSRLVAPEGPALWSYYQAHLKDFQRPAMITWREIAVKPDRNHNRAAAKAKAEALLDRLRHGEDFATLATKESQGPTAAKGGLWETEPDAVAAPAVNAALRTLPLNTVSTILEAPTSYHIVRVEARREAGPTPFYEVQKEIRATIQDEAARRESMAYTEKLREKTIITYHFGDGRGQAPAPRDAQTKPAATP